MISRMHAEHGMEVEWKNGGYLFAAYGKEQEKSFSSLLPMHHSNGLESHFVDVNKMRELVPGIKTEGLNGGLWTPQDGSGSDGVRVVGW